MQPDATEIPTVQNEPTAAIADTAVIAAVAIDTGWWQFAPVSASWRQ